MKKLLEMLILNKRTPYVLGFSATATGMAIGPNTSIGGAIASGGAIFSTMWYSLDKNRQNINSVREMQRNVEHTRTAIIPRVVQSGSVVELAVIHENELRQEEKEAIRKSLEEVHFQQIPERPNLLTAQALLYLLCLCVSITGLVLQTKYHKEGRSFIQDMYEEKIGAGMILVSVIAIGIIHMIIARMLRHMSETANVNRSNLLDLSMRKNDVMQTLLSRRNNTIEQLQRTIDLNNHRLSECDREIENLKQVRKQLSAQLTSSEDNARQLQQRLDKKIGQRKKLRDENRRLQRELSELQEKNTAPSLPLAAHPKGSAILQPASSPSVQAALPSSRTPPSPTDSSEAKVIHTSPRSAKK